MSPSVPTTHATPFLGQTITEALRQAAIFGEKRHEILVGNVANVDTPTYKTRDLDTKGFQEALEAVIHDRRSPSRPPDLNTHPYLQDKPRLDVAVLSDPILADPRNITFQDANNRSIEQEMVELTKNVLKQSFLLQMLSNQMSQLETVISERV